MEGAARRKRHARKEKEASISIPEEAKKAFDFAPSNG